jgi:hypothetical protein
MVLEVNALRNSPLGELLLQCLAAREGGETPSRALQRMGIEPLRDVDRVGITEHGLRVSGDFRRANWVGLLGTSPCAPYGDRGQITSVDQRGTAGGTLFATRGADSLSTSATRRRTDARVLDAVEGRGPAPRPLLTPEQSYGELYGVVSGTDLARTLGGSEPWARALVEAASKVEVHLDARRDVALVADVAGEDAHKLEDLGKTLGGALALARVQARAGATPTRRSCSASPGSRPRTGTPCRWRWRSRWRWSRSGSRSAAGMPTRDGERGGSAVAVAGEVAEDDLVEALLADEVLAEERLRAHVVQLGGAVHRPRGLHLGLAASVAGGASFEPFASTAGASCPGW